MQVVVNGELTKLADAITIAELLEQLEIEGKIAVELNQAIIPKSLHKTTQLQDNDQIEIVNAIGGG